MTIFHPCPKPEKVRDPKYLRWLQKQEPLIDGFGQTIYHHLKLFGDGGTATKPGDDKCIPIAFSVHQDIDSCGEKRVLCESYGYTKKDLEIIASGYYNKYKGMEK